MAEEMESEYVADPNAIDISPNQDGGVLKSIVSEGHGNETPNKGVKVFVHYTGKLIDGTKFDSSLDRGELFEFTLGKGEVIKAWDIGVATMKQGEKCILICKPEYAYGEKGSPPKIPANATLIFEVELFKWKLEDLSPDKDEGILRSVIKAGEGYMTPNEGATVEVHLVGKCAGNIFEDRTVKYELGEGFDENIVEGLDIALKKFKKGEKSKIILSPKYAFGAMGKPELNIPSNSTIEYEVTLISFEKAKESWSMTSEEKLEQSEIVKDKGNNYFKKEKYEMALKQYQKIINYLQYDNEMEGEQKEKKNLLLVAGYLNVAACSLKLEKYCDVIQNCDKALDLDSKNVKGFFRRGQARLSMRDYDLAKEDFTRVLEMDATNKAAQKFIHTCNQNLKKELEKEKKMYKAIFQKLAEENSQESNIKADKTNNETGHFEKMETDDDKQAAADPVQA